MPNSILASTKNLIQLSQSIDSALATVTKVEKIFKERKITCHPGSSLGRLFSKVGRIGDSSKPMGDKLWRETFLLANEAIRIARAIEVVLDISPENEEVKEIIHRITRSNMSLSSRHQSLGKDALWELDLYRHLKLRGVEVKFGKPEPDLVSVLDDGIAYGIPCKKLSSELQTASHLEKACRRQLRARGLHGIVAFNLDDLEPPNSVVPHENSDTLGAQLEKSMRDFIRRNERHFLKEATQGNCDGILVSITVISESSDMSPPITVSRRFAAWTSPDTGASLRFSSFIKCLDRTPSSI